MKYRKIADKKQEEIQHITHTEELDNKREDLPELALFSNRNLASSDTIRRAISVPRKLTRADVLALQRTVGNRIVTQVLRQPTKLELVDRSDDEAYLDYQKRFVEDVITGERKFNSLDNIAYNTHMFQQMLNDWRITDIEISPRVNMVLQAVLREKRFEFDWVSLIKALAKNEIKSGNDVMKYRLRKG